MIGTALLLAVMAFATHQWIIAPDVDQPTEVDAIVVLGGDGERTMEARRLVAAGVSSEVWISSLWLPEPALWVEEACRPPTRGWQIENAEVTCFEAEQQTTRGEARSIAELSDTHGWESIAVVATTDQITRGRRLIERCFDGELYMVDVAHSDPLLFRVMYEWGAGLKATVLRGC